ncbi:MAG TPA: serine/threonine-protein kinase [Gemmatimonadaceae bacterium]
MMKTDDARTGSLGNPKEDLKTRLQAELGDAYSIERELPRGGMSRVFVAKENALGRQVVIKVLAPELTASLSAERFKRETLLAARLQHPNIVPLLASGMAGQSLYYTMPLVDGESLRERIDRERPMSFANIIRILEEVSSALAYAHGEGIIHRDIKPENVMFFHGRAVVLDFGIGKALSAAAREEGEGRITQAGVSLGTPTYIAPEQAAGDPTLDHRADIYALGVVAYEMITGHPPFHGRTPQALMAAHARNAPESLNAKRADVPQHLAGIIMKTLAKAPGDRPSSATEIVHVLTSTASGKAASSISPFSRVPAWIPWALAAISTTVAIALALRR